MPVSVRWSDIVGQFGSEVKRDVHDHVRAPELNRIRHALLFPTKLVQTREINMKTLLIIMTLVVMSLTSISTFAKKKAEIPEYTVEGLKLIPDTKDIAYVWAEPGADLAQYDRVYLVDPYVAFKKNWQRDHNRNTVNKVRTSDMDRIKISVKELFMEIFTEELEKGGYTLANERAEDVLIVKPAIIDLDVKAPDVMGSGRSNTFTTHAGSMTLYLELYDSETDDLLAKALDPTGDRTSGYMQWQSGPANRAAAKRMMRPWAEALRKGLDQAREATKQEKE